MHWKAKTEGWAFPLSAVGFVDISLIVVAIQISRFYDTLRCVPSAYSEASFLADLVDRGLLDAGAARELITITPADEATLLAVAETDFDLRLVRAAVTFRKQVLERFNQMVAVPDLALADPERAVVDYLMACK
jgi:hypothetical protein